MEPGLQGFKELLKEFRGLSLWAVGGAAAVPFAAEFVSFSPPWPDGIVGVTAIIELMTLIFVYQFLKRASRKRINHILIVSALILAPVSTLHLIGTSLYTYETPMTGERWVKGFVCTTEAVTVFKEKCPHLGEDALKSAEYEAERLWTAPSITITRIALVLIWLTAFIALSVLIGSFLIYQAQIDRRKTS